MTLPDLRPDWLKSLKRLISATPSVPVGNRSHPMFGTVRQLSPLRISLDNDPTTTLSYAPPCLDYPTHVGQRVWVETYGQQVVILGVTKSGPDSGGDAGLPVGSGGLWTAPGSPPAPWMLAEGQLLLRTEYPALSTLYGNTFPGSTATHVALPDARGRTAVHLESGSSRFGTLGGHIGEKDVTLTIDEMPSHTHEQDPHEHGVRYRQTSSAAGTNYIVLRRNNAADSYDGIDADAALAATATNQDTGGGLAHNNIQPSLVLRYMVRVR